MTVTSMVAQVSLPAVVLFFEGTRRLDVFQKVVAGLQRGGRRVHVFVEAGIGSPNAARADAPLVGELLAR